MQPYLSFVATSRNDNHGGDLNKRTQAFISALFAQAERHEVPIELILVEWNPPADRQSLAKEYDWGANRKYSIARVITVPREIHDTFINGKAIPLYQMIAKNVGVRRARGAYVICTNIDIIFDDDLFEMAKRKLFKPGILYGVNRTDIEKDYPIDADIETQLAYCRSHILRQNRRNGTYNTVTGDVSRIYADTDPIKEIAHCSREWRLKKLTASVVFALEHVGHQLRVNVKDRARHVFFIARRYAKAKLKEIPQTEYHANLIHYYDVVQANRRFMKTHRQNIRDNLASLDRHYESRHQFISSRRNLLRLHTNACGDFAMTDAASWKRLHAYCECDIFSMHIDGLFVYAAYAGGVKQLVLDSVRIYHIEHAAGSGFTPEHQDQLWDRLRARGVPFFHWQEIDDLAEKIFNGDVDYRLAPAAWGMRDKDLPEVAV